ncbi:glycosyl hydrolase [Hymenobacter caeli]|uniref:Mannan endo-1,4-beta-mannosidase n=1 Tax=Hymenobacter caeli TaxID=2735894 RepID=A0ABX2FSH7_9BACT|nr:glycosyl hydrolase [Hymenobacter caeli]NRT19446.1 mannan endo-1,4-beta-mannosidase [Hymenobacter caeli]
MHANFLLTRIGRWGQVLAVTGVALAPVAAQAQSPTLIHLEAESAILKGVVNTTTNTGYSGTGYAADFENSTDSLIFTFPAQATRYQLVVRYTASPATATNLSVNGVISSPALANTGTNFGSATVGTFVLLAGTNKISFAAGRGYYGIDYIELAPVVTKIAPLTNGRAEAEDGLLNGVTVATTPTGFSGTGYVTGFDNSDAKNAAISFNNPTAGLFKLTIGYTSPYDTKVANVTVNDSKTTASFMKTATGTDFLVSDGGTFLLPQGTNTVTIGGGYGYYGIDYIQITPTTVSLPTKPAKQLTDPLATPTAKALHSYLVDLYGTKTLSGQQDDQYANSGSEVKYVLATTGKEPAIVSMDLLNYASAAVARYGPSSDAERYLQWSPSGNGRGITALIWHWRAPADNVTTANPTGDPGGAFYTTNTAFNFAAALNDTTSTNYHLLLKDIDLISVQLKKFQDAGIPVLWRPLHETPGTFFWWGNQGPDNFKKLWQLLYTRMTGRNQLHNLIWVYCANAMPDPTWYPGDNFVDVAGDDIYQSSATPDPNVNISGNWTAMRAMAPNKLIALTETESLVNPDQERGYATWWSWFCAWQGSYIRNQPVAFLRSLYADADIITKDELADWAATALATRSGAAATAAGLAVFPNPATGSVLNARLRLTAAQEVTVELVNTLGQRLAVQHPRLIAGDNQFQVPLAGVAPGVYQLVVRQAGQSALSQRVLVTP